MNTRKQTAKLHAETNYFNKPNTSFKENNTTQYQLDPKIVELKKKYQLENNGQNSSKGNTHRPPVAVVRQQRQQDILKRLQNIKSQLQAIPDWQDQARSILFGEPPQKSRQTKINYTQNIPYPSHARVGSEYLQTNNNKIFEHNLGVKVNETSSIQRSDHNSRYQSKVNRFVPTKNISQFKLDRNKYQKKDYSFDVSSKSSKFDEKISEIQRKIKQSETKKRNLGVDFVPFNGKSASKLEKQFIQSEQNFRPKNSDHSTYANNSTSVQKLRSWLPRPSTLTFQATIKQVQQFESVSPRFAPIQQNYSIVKQKSKQNGYAKKNRSHSVYLKPNKAIDIQTIKQNNKETRVLLDKAEQALKQRKKKISTADAKKGKQNTVKLVQAFCEQVKLDQKFRNCKLWLRSYKNDKKMQRIRSLLSMQGIKLSQSRLAQQFGVNQKQDNPFFSVTSQDCDIEQVVRCYLECERYWKKNLVQKFSKSSLEDEDFNCSCIDLDKKGYVVVEDFVRFLNMETGTLFRNRDLFTIFKRLANNSDKLDFQSFGNVFYA